MGKSLHLPLNLKLLYKRESLYQKTNRNQRMEQKGSCGST